MTHEAISRRRNQRCSALIRSRLRIEVFASTPDGSDWAPQLVGAGTYAGALDPTGDGSVRVLAPIAAL
jgi:hypothetical protein